MFGIMRKAQLPNSVAQAAGDLIADGNQQVSSAQVTVSSGGVSADADIAAAAASAVAAERQRAAEIAKAAGEGQEKLALQLIANGSSKVEALEALLKDIKQGKVAAAAAAPQISAADVAAQVLKELRTGAPPVPSTSDGSEPSAYEQYKAIGSPSERQRFYAAHKAEIDGIANKPKQEAK